MRIFCVVRHSTDPRFYYGGLWSGNFYPALRQLGHEIIESKVDLLPASRFMHVASNFNRQELVCRADITQRIVDEVRAAHSERPVDLFLSYFYNAHFDAGGFAEIRQLGIPSVNFYCNSIHQFDYVAAIAANADFAWHAERDAREDYLKIGARPVWVQMAADPEVYHPLPNVSRNLTACFVGQRYADRDRWMAALIQAGVPVEIYGPGWGGPRGASVTPAPAMYLGRSQRGPGTPRSYLDSSWQTISQQGPFAGAARLARQVRYRQETKKLSPLFAPHAKGSVSFESIAQIFASYEVILNFSNVWADSRPASALIPHVRLRDFEGPMCRTCYLTGHTDEIEEFYEVGKEIDTYRTRDELVDKTKFYLKDHAAAERLRAAGFERARRDHTWVRRFQELFENINLKRTPHGART
jgi:spore maturation protein CgeB